MSSSISRDRGRVDERHDSHPLLLSHGCLCSPDAKRSPTAIVVLLVDPLAIIALMNRRVDIMLLDAELVIARARAHHIRDRRGLRERHRVALEARSGSS